MKSQVATILTIAGLATATGGAVGVASSGDTGTQGGAASGQYVVTTAPAAPPSAVPPSAAPATGGGSPSGVVDPVLIGAGGAAVLAGIGLFGLGRRRRGSAGES